MTTWIKRLKEGLQKSSARLSDGITHLVTARKLDEKTLEELEDLLITSDLGTTPAHDLVQKLAQKRYDQTITSDEIRLLFAKEIEALLTPYALPLVPERSSKPFIIMVVGVNGSGKTTSIGKLAKQWKEKGYQISLIAGDTFRAAATEQLESWAQRAGILLEKGNTKDAAGLVYEALQRAHARRDDVVIIDTAGRLHTKSALMDELIKIQRVIQKIDPTAPHATLLVLDALTGQNALTQVKVFKEAVKVSGLILTKLDGTAKGGVLVAITQQHALPIHAIGVGEAIDDLHPFSAKDFAHSLMGVK